MLARRALAATIVAVDDRSSPVRKELKPLKDPPTTMARRAKEHESHSLVHRGRLVALLTLGYGVSSWAFRPTILSLLPRLLGDLGLDHEAGGSIISTCQLTYMAFKPLAQFFSDQVDPRILLTASTIVSGLSFCAVALSTSKLHVTVLLILLMVAQAPHTPAMSKLLSQWFEKEERGGAFSYVNSAVNVASCTVPLLVSTVLGAGGTWHSVFLLVGTALCLVGLGQALFFWSSRHLEPRDLQPGSTNKEKAGPGFSTPTKNTAGNTTSPKDGEKGWAAVLQPSVLLVAFNFALVYAIRLGIEGWLATFLKETTRPVSGMASSALPDNEAAAVAVAASTVFLFWWQVGGFIGTAAAGPVADMLHGRCMVIASCQATAMATAAAVLHWVHWTVLGQAGLATTATVLGACVYGQRLLFNLSVRDNVPLAVAGRAEGLTSLVAELGGSLAGFPLVRLVTVTGTWSTYSLCLVSTSAVVAVINLVLARVEARKRDQGQLRFLQKMKVKSP
eukprot:CAMPEP_0172623816 /NCGR_PEP_ID=MMETSP1068-20121228/131734_1 /TAXON_ID=35684 /ORGANISM="Pseudopedinella elastica, Strain CCMP716" /LENGTH=504 /DNA_ID=CAMNT_0013432521 /DNA_START=90 /DNA_END=1604 /DNA_ORIENTATION=+